MAPLLIATPLLCVIVLLSSNMLVRETLNTPFESRGVTVNSGATAPSCEEEILNVNS